MHFRANGRPLSVYTEAARRAGRIVKFGPGLGATVGDRATATA